MQKEMQEKTGIEYLTCLLVDFKSWAITPPPNRRVTRTPPPNRRVTLPIFAVPVVNNCWFSFCCCMAFGFGAPCANAEFVVAAMKISSAAIVPIAILAVS